MSDAASPNAENAEATGPSQVHAGIALMNLKRDEQLKLQELALDAHRKQQLQEAAATGLRKLQNGIPDGSSSSP